MVWDGRQLQKTNDWSYELNDTEIDQLLLAVTASLSSTRPLAEQSHHDFDLAKLKERFTVLHDELLHGRGFTLIRGLSKTDWTDAELTRAYWIIGSMFGQPVSQNARADLLGHVTDLLSPFIQTPAIL